MFFGTVIPNIQCCFTGFHSQMHAVVLQAQAPPSFVPRCHVKPHVHNNDSFLYSVFPSFLMSGADPGH